ncbi:MAG: tetratricopeptide (TPR) repeat protein, partial [Flavobacteriaceae bacterium]
MKHLLIATLFALCASSYSMSQADTIQAIVLNSDSLDAAKSYNSGIDKFKSNNFEGAVSDFTKAIELADGFYSAYLNRGSAYMELKKYSEAISDYNTSLNDPENK